ncbi:PTS transporter subunit EIIC [Spiroplasma platyhelix]|uniref:PTS transporter subunit EIIC n=1 Tax=Spiroplasma platyhelix PALS-1 TaxID=1276218 RepID=A0A846TPD8_9MOLU|nr:PTS transporter subunit EIIC [Spiroplasma platyhelix]MBE4703777.1 PTS system N-acetylmuramic acid-specific EIIBC component [Spiroplasma platyhelix PALS-1]NKE38150.1 PTS transporter subunit EIIC [Spiroplasma platyhelix PALS-1]UJB29035.1 PTS system N-acetylmuramic acid-specific EIIBC component [Spiroplasma platyhelix PALS-1]
MSKKNSLKTAEEIAKLFNQGDIVSFTNCMTRLRITVRRGANIDQEKIKSIENVTGLIVNDTEYQIILGPGFVNQVTNNFKKFVNLETESVEDNNIQASQSLADLASFEKQKLRAGGSVKKFLTKISKVFTPLIPAFIGAGLLSGIAGIILSSGGGADNASETIKSWNSVLAFALAILTNVFIIAVGWRLGEEFGGNAGLCALIAAMFCGFAGANISGIFIPVKDTDGFITAYNFLGILINKDTIQHNWFTVGFVNLDTQGNPILGAPHAGLIGAMIAVGFTIFVEKQFRKFMPGALDTIVTPILVILAMIFLNFVFIIPAAGYLFTAITFLFNNLYTNPFGAALLAGIFLFALAFGVHQGFLPIYFALIADTGVNGLFPIMCMGGVAQVGVAISMWIMAGKGSLLRKQISGAIIPGFLGIGEPLIYGISLPRVKPFFVSCIAAAFGGFIMGALNTWGGLGIGMNAATGPGGLTAAIMMTTVDGNVVKGILVYLSVVFVTYFIGAGLCFFAYSRVARYGAEKTTNITREWLVTMKDKDQEIWNKIVSSLKQFGLMLTYVTLIGLPIIWLTWYYKSSNEDKMNLKEFKLV